MRNTRPRKRFGRSIRHRQASLIEGLELRRLLSAAYALFGTSGTVLAEFDTATPATISSTEFISGLQPGETLRGLDFRPATGELFALGITPTAGDDEGRIYKINTESGSAVQVGAAPFATNLVSGASYGFDFNPAVDRIRIFNTEDQNLRVNPNSGTLVQFDTPLNNPANDEEVSGGAYDRNVNDVMPVGDPAPLTTLFGIDFINDLLVRIGGVDGGAPEGSPNLGVVTEIGPLGITTASPANGFDIGQDGIAYAALTDSATSLTGLYTIDLSTGAATLVDNLNNGAEPVRGVAIEPDNFPPVGVPDDYDIGANNTLIVDAPGVLDNDTDPEDDPLTAEKITDPLNGTLTFNPDGSFEYEPDLDFIGVDQFAYVPNDGTQDGAVTIVTINVVPEASIDDVAIEEGDSGDTLLTFTVTLSAPAPGDIEYGYKTQDNTAKQSSNDYEDADDTITFAAGDTTQQITITINGDKNVEPDETFFVNLTGPGIGDGQGVGTIINDDIGPKVSIVTDPCDGSKKAVKIEGTDSSDTIKVTKNGSNQGKVKVEINGSNKGTFSFSGTILVYGNKGNDNITIDSAITRSALIFGGDGKDTANGGAGADVISGQNGDDSLKGNSGRDIVIGGNGADKVDGGSGDDILVAGKTDFDNSTSSLCKLLDEWTRTDKGYTDRKNNIINGGGLNGSTKLNADTAFSAANPRDTVTGGSNRDLFFVNVPGDSLTDKAGDETVVDIG